VWGMMVNEAVMWERSAGQRPLTTAKSLSVSNCFEKRLNLQRRSPGVRQAVVKLRTASYS
jgi:hypothetical protein